MERLKKAVTEIASTPDSCLSELPFRRRALVPLLSLASALFRLSLSLRHRLYRLGLIQQHRLPVPVISVGNLTWGGNGKTPMVEYIARFFDEIGIPPLILTRGYAGGDEARMLQRHLLHTSTRIGVGANRSATAASIFRRHGYMDFCSKLYLEKLSTIHKFEVNCDNEKVGAAILDDGMQAALECGKGYRDTYVEWLNAMGKQPLDSTWAFERTTVCTLSSQYFGHSSCRFGIR